MRIVIAICNSKIRLISLICMNMHTMHIQTDIAHEYAYDAYEYVHV